MTLSTEAIGVITAMWTVIGSLAGLVYRELRARIAEKDTRIAALEQEAREAVKAKDLEIAEWRRLVQTKLSEPHR